MRRFVSATDGNVYELDPDKHYFTHFGENFSQNNLQQVLAVFRVPEYDPVHNMAPVHMRGSRATLRSGHIVSHWTDLDR